MTLRIRADLVEFAKNNGINMSQLLEKASPKELPSC
ncbi:hypothetical protein [Thermococcus sp. 2319x1]